MRVSTASLSLLLFIGSVNVVVHAFVPRHNGRQRTVAAGLAVFGRSNQDDIAKHSASSDGDAHDHDVVKAFRNWFGAIALSSIFALHPLPPPASATTMFEDGASMHIAETVKVLDMGLPSYGEISDAKASVETVEGLAQEQALPVQRKTRAPKEAKSDSGGGGAMSAILPSLNKKGPKASSSEAQTAKQEAIQRKKDEMKAELQAKKDAQAQERKEAQEAAQAAKEEKAALRDQERSEQATLKEQERAEKAALRQQEKEEKKQEATIKVVDAGLPSYSDSTSGKEKSVFSF